MLEMKEWDGFEGRLWKEEINVRQFIQDNYTPYDGNEDFLAEPTEATNKLWGSTAETAEARARKRRSPRYGDRGCNRYYSLWSGIY